MDIPRRFSGLPEYTFPRLRRLLDGIEPGGPVIPMSIGEPQHAFPDFVGRIIAEHAHEFSRYPVNEGMPELLQAIAAWHARRHGLTGVDPERHVMALNGTREGLFNACVALCPEDKGGARPVVLLPNPFYQCYAVAALAAGAEPVYVPATAATGFLPDFAGLPAEILNRTAIAYMCSPSNPQGAVAGHDWWRDLLTLAERHDFRVFADECYSEIWRDAPPPGAAGVAAAMGADPERILCFNSLSKRSNVPGLRVGYVAGGPVAMAEIKRLRAYAGAPIPMPLQRAATALWQDEAHVDASRAQYVEKFHLSDQILGALPGYAAPKAGFFLWLPVPDGEAATVALWREFGVRTLPGAYLAREDAGSNPGAGYIRVALVASGDEVATGLRAVRDTLERVD